MESIIAPLEKILHLELAKDLKSLEPSQSHFASLNSALCRMNRMHGVFTHFSHVM
jgi:hypothetical protein